MSDFKEKFKKAGEHAEDIADEAKSGYEKLEKKTGEVGEKVFSSSIFWGVLSYLGVLFFVPLLLKRKDRFAQFHAKQGLIMFILSFLISIPILGWILGIYLAIIWMIVVVQVFRKKYWEIPLVGILAKKLDF